MRPAGCGCSPTCMTARTLRRAKKKPLVTSTVALRALATAITLSSFGGMTIFADENLHVSNAPLQPSALAAVAPVANATPAPTTAPTTTSRTRVRSSVTTTTTAPVTRTKQS
jgi:hypothetical protein